jgi:hypothetical protein
VSRRETVRDFALCLLYAAFLTAVALACFCVGQNWAELRHKARARAWRATGATVMEPGHGRGLMIHVEPCDSAEAKP